MEQLVPIGQFAALTRLSLKALRLYDENGLLPSARVDPDSGYRFYRLDQVHQARLIWMLRAVDMPLVEIASFLDQPSTRRLDAYVAALQARQRERERVLGYVRQALDAEEKRLAGVAGLVGLVDERFEVRIKEVAAQPYVSRSATVGIGELASFITQSIGTLTTAYAIAGPPFTIFHEAINDESDGRIEVCLPTASLHEGGGTLPAGPIASTVAVGAQTDYPHILAAYGAVAIWMEEHGHEMAGSPREIYLTDPAKDETTRMEIAWPIR